MGCIETSLEQRGNQLECKENIVKGVGDMSIKKLKAPNVFRPVSFLIVYAIKWSKRCNSFINCFITCYHTNVEKFMHLSLV